ncbi:hypothetical protein MBAV_002175 [Candidatus Magnetobacterium bavaricum]|uniref:BREX-4 system phosphatase PglZ n=1 Tax=Candidatus Magnetobacterium bavaricum TaxID=29290 RepID=A0A0F3GUU3_9BACT|nr:hypothetical protein MBAV_002175 [Candidatus Magnetobacterium bavaricum]
MIVNTFDELRGCIDTDLKRKDIRIVRFIGVDSLEMWIKVKSYLTDICTKSIKLSDFCGGEDLTPNINSMINDLKKITENTLLVPLSEHLRINNRDTDHYLSRIINLDFESDIEEHRIRVFIPMYQMKNKLSGLVKRDTRLELNVLLLETGQDEDYSLTIVSNDLGVNLNAFNLTGYKRYLGYWEENPGEPVVLHTSNAKFYKDMTFADNVKVLVTAFDVLRYHYNISTIISESFGKDYHWKETLKMITSYKTLNNVFEILFYIPRYDAKHLFSKWNNSSDFERWAIWLWSKLEVKGGYLWKVLDKNYNFETLMESITNSICEIDTKNNQYIDFYTERRQYMKCLSIGILPPSFWEKIKGRNPLERLYYLTDCTLEERCETIKIITTEGLTDSIIELLKIVDPYLKAYIEPYIFNTQRYTDYFAQYKQQKLANTVNNAFIDKVREYSSSKGTWWELDSRNKIIDDMYDKGTLIFWIDALGVEYLSLISVMLNEHHRDVCYRIKIGFANIPTITELNNDFLNGRISIAFRELDNAKHNSREYPEYIFHEFELIERALKSAIEKLSEHKKVIITSDHGASRLAVIAHDKAHKHKVKDGAIIQRHGRYCIDSHNEYEKDICGCIDKDKYHVFADYDRFSVQGRCTGEIHGGASLEEVLVPIIELSKKSVDISSTETTIAITLRTPSIRLKPGHHITVEFTINKDYDKLQAEVGSKIYDCLKNNDYWHFEPEVDQKTDYMTQIMYGGKALGTFQYKVKKGITSKLEI